ncbi:MAG: shikimate dehydrogenase [Christensenellaceae bacterium]|nr:shikimate dehydrogenase [Christensenellaceae bacterium]
MKHYALLGEKLGHSLSVPIHEAIFERLGIDADYRLIELPRGVFADKARRLLGELDGFNITIPYKQEIMPLLDEIDPQAAAIHAVNTVVTGASSHGYNTDAAGFASLLRRFGIDPAGQVCYVLGGGGTSNTACHVLQAMGAKSVHVVSRRPADESILDYDRFHTSLLETGGLIVNTTPAGMKNVADTCPIAPDRLGEAMRHASGVVDAIYNPPETVLTRAAHDAGIPACTGLYMLIRQAVEAEALWQGHPMPDDLTDTLMKELTLL